MTRLITDDCAPMVLVTCAECIYCHVNGSFTRWTCERQYPARDTAPEDFCSHGERERHGVIEKTGDFIL